jgi:N-carbamoyl-L-amino-acid hydrolase
MHLRKNALLGAARMIERIHAIALAHAPSAVGTVGLVEVKPNSRNVVPGEVFFAVDFRHPEEAVLDVMEAQFRAALPEVMAPLGLEFAEKRIWHSPAVAFDPELIACVRKGAEQAGYPMRDMVSGAGHDAAYIARVAPTTMIFVPCLGGISHNEAESTTFDECAAGAQVLLEAVVAYDARTA